VFFDTGKATIKKVSYPLLDEVADVLRSNPGVELIEVQGHTDDVGNDASKGIEDSRLTSQGYGETQPLDRRSNEQAWAKNRRVAFLILKRGTE
jgi:OOP family OmpA-OmpF porin